MSNYFTQFQKIVDRLKTVEPVKSSHVCTCTEEAGLSDLCKEALNLHTCHQGAEECEFCQPKSPVTEGHILADCDVCSGAQCMPRAESGCFGTCWWCCPALYYRESGVISARIVLHCIAKAQAVYKSICGLHPSVCEDHIAVDYMETIASYIEENSVLFDHVYRDHPEELCAPIHFNKKSKEFDRAVKYLQAARDKQYQETGIVFQEAKADFEARDTITNPAATKKRRKTSLLAEDDS